MIDHLHFSQSYVGILGSIGAAGWVVGALLYGRLFDDFSTKRVLNLSIAFGTAATAAYLLLFNEAAAAVLSFASGFAAMLATVATVTLAADFCPPRSEGFTFAVMMSIINLATASADIVGSYLFERSSTTGWRRSCWCRRRSRRSRSCWCRCSSSAASGRAWR